MDKKRNTNIEILRIISMVMIVFHHFAVHGDFSFENNMISIPRLWIDLISMGGKIGVDVFVLISGYFLVNDNEKLFNCRKILKFVGQVCFYSIGIYALFLMTHRTDLDMRSLIYSLFPITYSSYWFTRLFKCLWARLR